MAAAPFLGDATTSGLEPASRGDGPAPSPTTTVVGLPGPSASTVTVAAPTAPPPVATTRPPAPAARQANVGPSSSNGQARGADQGGGDRKGPEAQAGKKPDK